MSRKRLVDRRRRRPGGSLRRSIFTGGGGLTAAVRALKRGESAVFPTDTVTGLGCLAGNARAVRGLFALKGREKRKPLILFVPSIAHAERLSGKFPARVRRILRALWPGAFTAVLPLVRKMPPGVGLNGTVGIRIPDHPVPLGLLKRLRKPLATTSANLSGEAPECDAEKASAALGGRTAVVAGCSGNVPSTVADLTRWPPVILREGAVSGRRLRQLCRGG